MGNGVPGMDEVEDSESRGERSWACDKVLKKDAMTKTIGRVVARVIAAADASNC